MNDDYFKVITMLNAVRYTLSTNSDITSSFAHEVGLYEEYVSLIRRLSNRKKTISYKVEDFQSLELNLKVFIKKIASALGGYAAMTGWSEHLTNSIVNKNYIDQKTESSLYFYGLILLEKIREIEIGLSLFGITDKFLNDFNNVLLQYGTLLGIKSDNEFAATEEEEIEKLCQSAINLLEKTIDKLVNTNKTIFPKFCDEYATARSLNSNDVTQHQYYFAMNY